MRSTSSPIQAAGTDLSRDDAISGVSDHALVSDKNDTTLN